VCGKKPHTIQIQKIEGLRKLQPNIIKLQKCTNHRRYLGKKGQRHPDYTLEQAQHLAQDGENTLTVSPVGKAISIYQLNFCEHLAEGQLALSGGALRPPRECRKH
jgi:hypothetical protein